MSYLHGLYLDSFQTTKRHSYDGYSIYIVLFNSFLQGVYPVSVTEVRPYCTQVIGHNSVNVNWISTKLGTANCFNEPFKCAKFQPDWSMHWLSPGIVDAYVYRCLGSKIAYMGALQSLSEVNSCKLTEKP